MTLTAQPKRGRRSRPAVSPANSAAESSQRGLPPVPLRPTKLRRRPGLIGLGVALVALGALAMVYLTSTMGQTRQVVAITATVQRGEAIPAKNLVVVDMPTGPTTLDFVAADQLDDVAGKLAAVELLPGSLLTPRSFSDTVFPDVGRSVVGVALTSSQMPTAALHAGDQVRIVETPSAGGEPPSEDPLSIAATVVSAKGSAMGEQMIVNVEVDRTKAAALAARAATGRVALILDSVQE